MDPRIHQVTLPGRRDGSPNPSGDLARPPRWIPESTCDCPPADARRPTEPACPDARRPTDQPRRPTPAMRPVNPAAGQHQTRRRVNPVAPNATNPDGRSADPRKPLVAEPGHPLNPARPRPTPVHPAGLSKRAERRPYLIDEHPGLLERGEMTALV